MTSRVEPVTGGSRSPRTSDLTVFSTAPPSNGTPRSGYRRAIRDVARWSEREGCVGMLVYTDNGLVDPWLVAGEVLAATRTLCPLVAVQPVYQHPYSVAKLVATFSYLHRRRLFLNMVAGGFTNDLLALGDGTPHDRRYDRLLEYTLIIRRLLAGERVTLEGEFYSVRGLRLEPVPDPEHQPEFLLSGSSDAGREVARRLGATAITYPRMPDQERLTAPDPDVALGIRVGIIAREDGEAAWRIALERFPPDRRGQLRHQLAMKVSDSHWHRQLSRLAAEARQGGPYWLVPFEQYQTFCPYLVGSYDEVGRELGRYVAAGCGTLILDVPPNQEELAHTGVVVRRARAAAPA